MFITVLNRFPAVQSAHKLKTSPSIGPSQCCQWSYIIACKRDLVMNIAEFQLIIINFILHLLILEICCSFQYTCICFLYIIYNIKKYDIIEFIFPINHIFVFH